MRLPECGVELTGSHSADHGTEIVLALTEFLRRQGGRATGVLRRRVPASRWRPRDHLQHGPEYGATAAMFFIDEQTSVPEADGRSDEQVRLSRPTRSKRSLASSLESAVYERVLRFDLSTVVRTWRSVQPAARLPTSDLAARGIAGEWTQSPGQMPDGAVIIAAITSCTNTRTPAT